MFDPKKGVDRHEYVCSFLKLNIVSVNIACAKNKESFANSHITVNILIIVFFDGICFVTVVPI